MNISFTFKNFDPSEHLRKYARRRLEKLTRFVGKKTALETQVVMDVDKFRQKVEVQILGEGLNISASEATEDMYGSIDLALDKIESQIKKSSARLREHRRSSRNKNIDVFPFQIDEANNVQTITGRDHFSPKPMDVDEAAMQLETTGFEFLVFLNAEIGRVNVIYRRKNGDFGLIDPVI